MSLFDPCEVAPIFGIVFRRRPSFCYLEGMTIEKAHGIAVRGTDWSETSRITTLFTREFGKIRALAKGGRRIRSNFEVAFDLLTVSDIGFIRKHSGGLDLLTEARVRERFPHLREDLQSLYVGYYVAELLADGTQDYDPHPVLFDEAMKALRALAEPGDRPGRVSAFELVWLSELGYSPRIETCAGCAADVVRLGIRLNYSPTAGGVLCPDCSGRERDARPLSESAWNALRRLSQGEPDLPGGVRREVRQLLGLTVSAVLGRRPRMLAYLDGGSL